MRRSMSDRSIEALTLLAACALAVAACSHATGAENAGREPAGHIDASPSGTSTERPDAPSGTREAPDRPPAAEPSRTKPLLIPQAEGERQGRIVGRALACGAPRERTEATLRAAHARMLATVGGPFTTDRYLPALDRALGFEASLGRPSDGACAAALDAFARLDAER